MSDKMSDGTFDKANQYAPATTGPAHILLLEIEGKKISLTENWCYYTGQIPEETHDWGWLKSVHPEDRTTVRQSLVTAFKNGRATELEIRIKGISGEYCWFQLHTQPTLVEGKKVKRWLVGAIEKKALTAQQDNETLLTGQKMAFKNAMEGCTLTKSLEPLIQTIVEHFEGKARAAFYTIPAEGEGLHLVAGMSELYARDVNGFTVGPESLACGLAMHAGKPVITYDVENEPRWKPFLGLARKHNYRACWSFPVSTEKGPVLGTFAMYFEQPREPNPGDLKLAGILAHAAAIIISRHTELTKRTQAQEKLKVREAELAAVQKIGGVAGLDIDIANNMSGNRSPEYRRLHGLPDSTIQETHDQWLERLHPDDRQRAEKILLQALEGKGKIYEAEYRIIRPSDGQVRWIYAKADIDRNNNGDPVRLFGAHIDITAQKAMENITKKSEAYLEAIFSEAAVGLSVIDTSGKFLRVNSTLCRLLGRTRKELLDLVVTDVTGPDFVAPSLEALKQLLQKKRPVTLDKQYIRPDGTYIWANSTLSLLQLSSESDPVIVIVTADITERKEAEDTLTVFNNRLEYVVEERTLAMKEQQELLQATLDSTHEIVQILKAVRRNGEIIDFIWVLANRTSDDYYGEVTGKSLIENSPWIVKAGIFQSFREVVQTGIPQQYERYYHHSNFKGWFYQSVVKMDDGVVVFMANINERKKAEEEISGLNKQLILNNRELESLNSELATFNNIVASDYKVTLESLYLHLEHIIKTDAARLSDSGKSNVRRSQSAIQKLKLLTEDIIAFSKVRYFNQDFLLVNLQTVIENVVNDLGNRMETVNASITYNGVLPEVKGSPLLLSILFYHLLDNALKFMSGTTAPRITITATSSKKGPDHGISTEELYHEICIKDNGIGFPEDEAINIFTIFYRLHEKKTYKGSGIGLAVCKKIMDMHGGLISASSQQEHGSTFCCYFPISM